MMHLASNANGLPGLVVVHHIMQPEYSQVVRLGDMPNSYEVSIRTPVTPPRWEDFHEVRSPNFTWQHGDTLAAHGF
jgi:hypothetical protein